MAEEGEGNFGREKICRSCVFFTHQYEKASGLLQGQCWRFPPSDNASRDIDAYRFCGEWKAKVNNASTE